MTTQTIKQNLEVRLTKGMTHRLERLIELDAYQIIIDGQRNSLKNPLEGIKGVDKFGDLVIIGEPIISKGRGGKQVVFFNTEKGKFCFCKKSRNYGKLNEIFK